MNPARTCRWVRRPAAPGVPAIYCEAPVPYRMVPDGGEAGAARVREYGTFCPGHEEAARRQREASQGDDD